MYALKVTACVLAMTSTVAVLAQAPDAMERSFRQEIARWKVQQTAAERDAKLVDQVSSAFDTAAKPSSGEPQVSKVNATLAPLKARYPDYRLSYRSNVDYCRVSRALSDARSAALNRKIMSLTHQQEVLALSLSYHRIMIKMNTNDILGQPLKRSDVAEAFREELARGRGEEVQTDWDGMDSLMEPSAGEEDCS